MRFSPIAARLSSTPALPIPAAPDPPNGMASFLARLCAPVMMRHAGTQDGGKRPIHMVVIEAHAGHRPGHHGTTMVAAFACDDLRLGMQAPEIAVVPNQLCLCLVCIRAGQAVEYLLHAGRRHLHQPGRETRQRFRRVTGIAMVICRLARLRGDRVRDFQSPITDIDAVKAAEPVDQLASVGELDPDPAPSLNNDGRSRAVFELP